MNWKNFLLNNPLGWALIAFVALTVLNFLYYFGTRFQKSVMVKKTFNIYKKNGKGLMFEDTNNQTYRVSNLWFKGEFDSMEDWNLLQPGQQATIEGYGYRVPMLGMYPNVYSVQVSKK